MSASWGWAGDAPGARGLLGGSPGAAPGSPSSGLPKPLLSLCVLRSAPSQRMSWMRKDVRGLDEVGTVFWGLPGALCPPGGSTPALISFSSRCPQPHCLPTLLAPHLSGRRPSLRGLIGDQAGVYALRWCLGSRRAFCCSLFLCRASPQGALPHRSAKPSPVPEDQPVAFLLEMIRERCPSEFIFYGIQTIPVWGFGVSRGSTGTALVGCCG